MGSHHSLKSVIHLVEIDGRSIYLFIYFYPAPSVST